MIYFHIRNLKATEDWQNTILRPTKDIKDQIFIEKLIY